jgi:hypothetical protein
MCTVILMYKLLTGKNASTYEWIKFHLKRIRDQNVSWLTGRHNNNFHPANDESGEAELSVPLKFIEIFKTILIYIAFQRKYCSLT